MDYTQMIRVPRRYGQELENFIGEHRLEWLALESTNFNVASLYTHVKEFSSVQLVNIPVTAMTKSLRELCENNAGTVHVFRFFDGNVGLVYCVACNLKVDLPVDAKALQGFVWKGMGKPDGYKWESDDVFCVATLEAEGVDEEQVATLLGCSSNLDAMDRWDKEGTGRYFRFYHRSLVQILRDTKFAYHEQKVLLAALHVAVEHLLNQSLKVVRDSVIRLSRGGMNDAKAEQEFEHERNRALVYNSALISSGLVKRANAAESAEISRRYADQIGLGDLCGELMEKLRCGGELLERLERTRVTKALAEQKESMQRQELQLKEQEKSIARNMKMLAMFGVVFGYLGSNVMLPEFIKTNDWFGGAVLLITVGVVLYLLRQQRVSN